MSNIKLPMKNFANRLELIQQFYENSPVHGVKSHSDYGSDNRTIQCDFCGKICTEDHYHANIFKIIMLDMRRPRGWAGFAEEKFAVNIIPYLLKYKVDISEFMGDSDNLLCFRDAVKNIVEKWINLSWPGGFKVFWDSYGLPENIHDYIAQNFAGYV